MIKIIYERVILPALNEVCNITGKIGLQNIVR